MRRRPGAGPANCPSRISNRSIRLPLNHRARLHLDVVDPGIDAAAVSLGTDLQKVEGAPLGAENPDAAQIPGLRDHDRAALVVAVVAGTVGGAVVGGGPAELLSLGDLEKPAVGGASGRRS